MSYETRIVRLISDLDAADPNTVISVSVNQDGLVHVLTPNDDSGEWYGELDFVLPPELAKLLGETLIQASKDAELA